MKSKVLYLGDKITKPSSGADQVNRRNQQLLESIFDVSYLPFVDGPLSKIYLSCTDNFLKSIDFAIKNIDFQYVFIQQSHLGRACRHIKKFYPNTKIIMFFHNIERQYAHEYMKTRGLKAVPFYLLINFWERCSAKYADYCITLNNRDSKLLKSLYGRSSDLELPTSFPDLFDSEKAIRIIGDNSKPVIDYLFVGVAFFANIEGVQWFIDEVMPKVEGHFYVIGKGMENKLFNNVSERIHILGFVDDLSSYYYRARYVVSPIHVGGGMKTKTAEALMYGKTILGSKEAFEGYEVDDRCMMLCESVDDYVKSIAKGGNKTNLISRSLFIHHYCDTVIKNKFYDFINRTITYEKLQS